MITPWLISPTAWLWKVNSLWCIDSPRGRWDWPRRAAAGNSYYSLPALKPGTRVVSNTFDMGDWRPDKEQSLPGADDDEAAYLSHMFFLWTIPQRDGK